MENKEKTGLPRSSKFLIAFFLILTVAVGVSLIRKSLNKIDLVTPISIMVIKGSTSPDQIGKLIFEVLQRWEKRMIALQDYGFDGTLDKVIYYEGSVRYEIDPNSPNWDTWIKRYLEIRAEATKG